jgi:CheY-like chemotaxis protein
MPTVPIVDDDPAILQVLQDHLESSGYAVATAPDTVVALQRLAADPPIDLCLVDLFMPSDVPDGLAFARAVRAERPRMPIILMTGYYTAGKKVEGLAALIYKPVDFGNLSEEIARQLSS